MKKHIHLNIPILNQSLVIAFHMYKTIMYADTLIHTYTHTVTHAHANTHTQRQTKNRSNVTVSHLSIIIYSRLMVALRVK